MPNILIVEDEKAIADLLEVYLKNENYNVIKYYSSTDVVRDIDNLKIIAIIAMTIDHLADLLYPNMQNNIIPIICLLYTSRCV